MSSAFKNIFADGAVYGTFRPSYPPALIEYLLSLCPSSHHALDVGCGTGQLTRMLAPHFGMVTAIDPSASQIAHAKDVPNVMFRQGSSDQLEVPPGALDLITAAQAAHWFDLPPFYAACQKALKKDGILALITYGVPVMEGPAGEVLADFYWTHIHAFWPTPRRHVEQGYRELAFPFSELDAPDIPMAQAWTLDGVLGYVQSWSAVAAAKAAGQADTVTAFEAQMRRVWGDPEAAQLMSWPLTVKAARL